MNNDSNNSSKAGGIGFLGLLALIFITLKLTGVIAWSWLWVLAPLWIPTALVIVILVVALIVLLVKEVAKRSEADTRNTRDLDREAAELGIERGRKETDAALAYRIKRMKDLTGRGRP
jgi:hypothetical protein